MGAAVQASPNDVFVSWLPLYHDMGLIGAWFAALYLGFPTVLMSPLAFLSHPSRWLWAIHRHRGTLSGGPNFRYELCLKRIDDAGTRRPRPVLLALRIQWRRAGESGHARRIRAALCAPWPARECAEAGLRARRGFGRACLPCARHALAHRPDRARSVPEPGRCAAGAQRTSSSALEVPCCGRAIQGTTCAWSTPRAWNLPTARKAACSSKGPSATSGYYRNPEQTRKLFAGAWLDTGDLAYLADGELYLSGRAKDMIIRGGRNLYPYELEQAVGALPGIRKGCVAVFGSLDPDSGTERLIVLAETRETGADVLEALRRSHQRMCHRSDRPAGGRHRARPAAHGAENLQWQDPARGQPRVLRARRP